jgi:hypothetical protein
MQAASFASQDQEQELMSVNLVPYIRQQPLHFALDFARERQ